MKSSCLLIVLLQSAWIAVSAVQNVHLLSLSPRRRLQELSDLGVVIPTPKPVATPLSRRLAADAQTLPTQRSPTAVASSATRAPDVQQQLIDEPDIDVDPVNISVSGGQNATLRPFKVAFFDEPNSWKTPQIRQYVMGELVPAAASILARSIRVRFTS